MSKKTKENSVLMVRVLENTKHPGGKFVTCDVLTYPSINDNDFDNIDKKDWIWETRVFPYPLFTNMKVGDVFLIRLETTEEYSKVGLYINDTLLEKSKENFINHDKLFNTKWKNIVKGFGKDGFFKNTDKK